MDYKAIIKANKEAWNEVMPKHQKAAKQKLDNLFSKPGFIIQSDSQVLDIFKRIQIKGKDVAHLCCNNGIELLSIKNMGANRCVGFDISELAIAEANERATKSNIDCDYICSNVYEIPGEYYDCFDVIHITSGCLGWMPDIQLFFKICNKLLRLGGVVFIHEIHPFSELLPFDNSNLENRLQIVDKYFHDGPIVENTGLDYIGGTQYDAKDTYWFVHTISDIIMSLTKNKFEVLDFIESCHDISAGHRKIEKLKADIPLSMLILGKKWVDL